MSPNDAEVIADDPKEWGYALHQANLISTYIKSAGLPEDTHYVIRMGA